MSATAWPQIQNGASRPLFTSAPTMPSLADTIQDWGSAIQFLRILKNEVDFQITESVQQAFTRLRFIVNGMIVPLTPRQLMVKPEGERAWKWLSLTTTADVTMQPDDETVYEGINFRVMGEAVWRNNGLVCYHLLQATGGPIQP